MKQFANEHEREAAELRHALKLMTVERDQAQKQVRRLEIYADDFVGYKDKIKELQEELKAWREDRIPPMLMGTWKETAVLKFQQIRDLESANKVLLRNVHRLTHVNSALRTKLLSFVGTKQVNHIETEAGKAARAVQDDN